MRLGKLSPNVGCKLVYVLRELRAGMEAELMGQLEDKLALLFEQASARGLISEASKENRFQLR
jgi:hypothetical protein